MKNDEVAEMLDNVYKNCKRLTIPVALLAVIPVSVYANIPRNKRDFVPIEPINIRVGAPKPNTPVKWFGPDGEVLPEKEKGKDSRPDASLFPKIPLDWD